jgi:hypothetical protein
MKLAQIRLPFHLRALSERWIGFSEDDAKINRRMRKIFCALPAKR